MSAMPTDVIALFTAAKRRRSSDDVVAQVREAIVGGHLTPGDRLPSERELCAAFNVSRSTLREALRMLESFGAVEIRPGASGGIFVTKPDERQLAATLETLVRFGGATDRELIEFGVSLVSETAYWAAVRADEFDLAAIDDALRGVERAADGIRGPAPSLLVLHAGVLEAIARASKNSLRIALVLGIHRPLLGSRLRGPAETVRAELAGVSEAVRGHNARIARVRMRRHLQRLTIDDHANA